LLLVALNFDAMLLFGVIVALVTDLHIEESRRSEIQDLRHHIGREKSEGRPRKTPRQGLAQSLHEIRGPSSGGIAISCP
jgi:hypothetical protein